MKKMKKIEKYKNKRIKNLIRKIGETYSPN
jgi:hypothetical protein